MRGCSILAAVAAVGAIVAVAATAAPLSEDMLSAMRAADVVLLGEVHDNPHHHAVQAAAVAALRPAAVVWEMLAPETAARFDGGWLAQPGNLDRAIRIAGPAWPGFDLYRPVLAASGAVPMVGALVPRQAAEAAMTQGIAAVFGPAAPEYGLTEPLAAPEQAAREAEQMAAHCDAIAARNLPLMVDFQRLRDAVLARAAVQAFETYGAPVVVITGNGHARTDRGVPEVLRRVRPGLRVHALGQSEDGVIEGGFDAVLDNPAVARPDPCDAFRKPG